MTDPGKDQLKYPGEGYPPPYPHPYPPGYPSPYQGYPPGGYHGYPPCQAPPPAYYPQPQHLPPQELSLACRVIRFFLALMILLLLGAFMMSILTWIIFGSDLPQIHVDSLTVRDFNATDDSLKASWDVNITVSNMNNKVSVMFSQMDGYIGVSNDIIAKFPIDSFYVEPNRNHSLNLNFSTLTTKERDNTALDFTEWAEDRKSGNMYFSVRLKGITTSSTSESHWQTHRNLFVYCFSLKVQFPNATGPGYLVDDNKRDQRCLVWR